VKSISTYFSLIVKSRLNPFLEPTHKCTITGQTHYPAKHDVQIFATTLRAGKKTIII